MNSILQLLLVEDSAKDARLLIELLKDVAHPPKVTHVATLAQSLSCLAQQRYDCVLLDLRLPDSDGVDSVEQIHTLRRDITIVVLTGNDDQQSALAALRRGAQEYIVKGKHDGESLLLLLSHAIERERLVIALNQRSKEDYYRASHDSLTGLPNRQLFEDRLRTALSQGLRQDNQAVVCFVDLDGFKSVNDQHGHAIGDALLQKIALILQETARAGDTVARLSGDEFAVLLTHAGDAAQVAERMVQRVAAIRQIAGAAVQIGASIGMALHPAHGETPEQLLANADHAMYRAKAAGKGQWRFFANVAEVLQLTAPPSLGGMALQLLYQPWYEALSRRCMGLEALIRLNDDSAAASALQKVEQQKLLPLLGSWVLEQACRNWLTAGGEGPPAPRLAINISAAELDRRDYASNTLRLLGELGMPCAALQLEIAESELLRPSSTLLENLGVLRRRGVVIALDQFGRDHGALRLLQSLPLDVVKLDIGHVQALRSEPATRTLLAAVMAYVQALGLELIVCGIETQDDLDNLQGLEPRLLQGFGLGLPQALVNPRAALLPC